MKESLLIVGAGGLGRMTLEIAEENYLCFFVDDAYPLDSVVCGSSIVGNIAQLPVLRNRYNTVVVAIGDNELREKLMRQCINFGYSVVSIISPLAYVSKWSAIGSGCIVLPFSSVHNGASVGDGTVLCSHAEIHHDSAVGDFCVIYPHSVVRTNAIVGSKVKVGSNVTIRNNKRVVDCSTIDDGQII